MCTLAIYFRCSTRLPVVVAANRDEFYERATADPRVLAHDPWVVGGQDLQAGGTWFGVNEHRMVVGMLNRRTAVGPDPSRRSRGLLCLEALQQETPAAVLAKLNAAPAESYNGFNLLVANEREAYVVTNDGQVFTTTVLSPGLHLLTNLDLNDPTCPRIATSHRLFAQLSPDMLAADPPHLIEALRTLLANHDVPLDPRVPSITDTLCIHSTAYGTRSSSVVLSPADSAIEYWHAPGPPCSSRLVRIPLPA